MSGYGINVTNIPVFSTAEVFDGSGSGEVVYEDVNVTELCKMQETTAEIIALPICASEKKKRFRLYGGFCHPYYVASVHGLLILLDYMYFVRLRLGILFGSVALTYTLMICIAFVMFTMGCKVRLRDLWKRFKIPYGILIGFLCQFGIMPATAFGLAKLLSLPRAQALAVLIMGCIPGGNASNLLCYWCNGDLDLSIAMTAFSTILAFAMMPLCLYIYAQEWTTETVTVPFAKISIVLAAFIIPVAIGIAINVWKPKLANSFAKVGAVIGVLVIVAAGAMGIILYPNAWNIPAAFWIVGAILPICGYIFGFVIAFFLGYVTKSDQLKMRQVRTIAIETGMQNTQMCTAMLQVNYTCTCLILEMYAYPLVYFVYQVGEAILLCVAYQLARHAFGPSEEQKQFKACVVKFSPRVFPDSVMEVASVNSGSTSRRFFPARNVESRGSRNKLGRQPISAAMSQEQHTRL